MYDAKTWDVHVISTTRVGGLVEDVANDAFGVPTLAFRSRFVENDCGCEEWYSVCKIGGLMVHKLEGGGSTVGVCGGSTVYGFDSIDTC